MQFTEKKRIRKKINNKSRERGEIEGLKKIMVNQRERLENGKLMKRGKVNETQRYFWELQQWESQSEDIPHQHSLLLKRKVRNLRRIGIFLSIFEDIFFQNKLKENMTRIPKIMSFGGGREAFLAVWYAVVMD